MLNVILLIPPSPNNRRIARHTFASFESKANYMFHPRDMMAITLSMSPEDKAVLIDGTCDRLSETEFLYQAGKLSGDILFFFLSNICWESDYNYFQKIKTIFPNIPTFVLGDVFLDEDFRNLILKECDGTVIYPYMLDLNKMINFKKDNNIDLPGIITRENQDIFNKTKINTPNNIVRHDIFLKKGYSFPFARHNKFATVVRVYGCPNQCGYCANRNFPPGVRSNESLLREMDYLQQLGIEEIWFGDSAFGYYFSESVPLLEEMIKRYSFSWSCFFSHRIYKPEFLELMHKAGCHTIITGIDSTSANSLNQYNIKVDKSKLERLINHARELKMSVCADFIIGLDDETEEVINNTIAFGLQLPLDFASFNIAIPSAGSEIRENLKKQGMKLYDFVGLDASGAFKNLGNKHLSADKILKLRNRAVRKFYMRPSLIYRRFRKLNSWEHFTIQFREMVYLFKNIL